MLETRNIVRVWQESDVKHQVAIGWNAVPVSKARDVDHDLRSLALSAEPFPDEFPKLMNREFRGIDDQVGHGPDWSEFGAFRVDALKDGPVGSEWMRPPRFAEAASDHFLIRFEED